MKTSRWFDLTAALVVALTVCVIFLGTHLLDKLKVKPAWNQAQIDRARFHRAELERDATNHPGYSNWMEGNRLFGPTMELGATGATAIVWSHVPGGNSMTTFPVRVELQLPSKTNWLVWFFYDQPKPFVWQTNWHTVLNPEMIQ